MVDLPLLVPETQQRELLGRKKSREYRHQQKATRNELLRQEASLRQELIALRRLRKEETTKFEATQTHSFLLLRDLAKRLREERKIAERRQQQLIGLINNQTIYIKTIRDTVGKQLSTAMALVRTPYSRRIGSPTGAENYAFYIQGLDASFQITNEVFRAYNALFAGETRSVHKQVTEGVVEYFSPRSRAILPMSPLKAGDALWRVSAQHFAKYEGFVQYEDVQDPDNTLIESFIDSCVLETGMEVKVRQHFISRRFQFDNQVFITWHFVSEGIGVFSGLRMDETGWMRMKPSGSRTEPGTVLEMCICRAPPRATETILDESVANDVYKGLQRISERTLDSVLASSEAALLLLEDME
ncbi:hypothetical protein DVH05_000322 [Phytophthora capsici]|nr:hypothetical protein DVH05_000322 [Phytophthora capsici]